jgi:hypothetical protein
MNVQVTVEGGTVDYMQQSATGLSRMVVTPPAEQQGTTEVALRLNNKITVRVIVDSTGNYIVEETAN